MGGEGTGIVIRPWEIIETREGADLRLFKVFNIRKRSPRNGIEHDFLKVEVRNWVNVIAVTPDQQLVMVEQFRHGTESVDLEIPGGVMDDTDESPEATAIRELREETGYEGSEVRLIGSPAVNPAFMNNQCYTVLIENCRKTHETEFDPAEDIITSLLPIDEVHDLAMRGEIRHSLVIAALYYFKSL